MSINNVNANNSVNSNSFSTKTDNQEKSADFKIREFSNNIKVRALTFRNTLITNFSTVAFPVMLPLEAIKDDIAAGRNKASAIIEQTLSSLIFVPILPMYAAFVPLLSAVALADALTQATLGRTLDFRESDEYNAIKVKMATPDRSHGQVNFPSDEIPDGR